MRFPDVELTTTALAASPSGTVRVRVSCAARESRCAGRVTLRTPTAFRTATGHSRTIKASILTLATGPFTILGGQATVVKLHLSLRARALLARRHAIRARATLAVRDPQGVTHIVLRTVTIRAAKTARSPARSRKD